jgi:hypothetical protein
MATIINADTSDGLKLTSDTSGEIELQSAGTTKAKITSSGLQNASGSPITSQAGKNLIINGDMNIAQRGTSSTGITAGGYYTVDRWRQQISGGGTYTQAQTALTSSDAPFADGFSQSVKYDCTTAYTSANSFNVLRQIIEGQNLQQLAYGTSSAKSLTLSFWVKSNVTGTAVASLYSADSNKHIGQTYTIDATNTWEYKTVTFVGDTASTFDNDNNASLYVNLMMATGTDYTSGTLPSTWTTYSNADFAAGQTIDISASTSNEISFTGVQLEEGTTATPFEHLQYGQQLARCQRYYTNVTGASTSIVNCAAWSTSTMFGVYNYPTTMRAVPTMTYSALADFDCYMNAVARTPTQILSEYGDENGTRLKMLISGGVLGHAGWYAIDSGGGTLEFSAEL